MIDTAPFTRPGDRFPFGPPGRAIPISPESATQGRPWGMDFAVVPVECHILESGKHAKPTKTRTETRPTQFSSDGKVESDTQTVTVTD
ncbi:hypothetical protein Ssi02_73560 [Sinosporangium siamense]|uniref:Uncharacterized protein n=1 Tax=Sinosporangium siamense TaxID=1367973 RepID=A0A919V9E4_9ACTN|nr:hypothetical protein Ssi02_73560 [Sinosporangium siamense]